MSSSGSTNVRRTDEGLFIRLEKPQPYVIVDGVPLYSVNRAVDARGYEYPLKVSYGAYRYLLRADLEGAVYPVIFELRTLPDISFCSMVV